MNVSKIMSTFGIDKAQKKALYCVQAKTGISQTIQVELGLQMYLTSVHGDLLKQYGFTLDEHGKLIAPK